MEDILEKLSDIGIEGPALIIIAVLVLVLIIFGIYQLSIVPAMRKKGLKQAEKILKLDKKQKYNKAIDFLLDSLRKGLKKNDAVFASYLLAYAYSKKGENEKALVKLEEMGAKGTEDADILYLYLYVCAQLDKHEETQKTYEKNISKLKGKMDSDKMVCYAYLSVALKHWDNNEISSAVTYFEKIKALGHYTNKIPTGISNRQNLLALRALHDGNTIKAREYYEDALSGRSGDSTSETESKLGLVLCTWLEEDIPKIDDELKGIVGRVKSRLITSGAEDIYVRCDGCSKLYKVKESKSEVKNHCAECGKSFKTVPCTDADDKQKKEALRLYSDDEIMFINTMILYSQSFLFTMMNRDEGSGISHGDKEEYIGRLDEVLAVDKDEALARIAIALFEFFTAQTQSEQDAAAQKLESIDEVEYDEIVNIIQDMKTRKEKEKNVVSEYLEVISNYMSDSDIPVEYRQKLFDKLNKNSVFVKWAGENAVAVDSKQTEPSISLLSRRGDLIKERVTQFISTKNLDMAEDKKEIEATIQNIQKITKEIQHIKTNMERDEHKVLELTGEMLLKEDS